MGAGPETALASECFNIYRQRKMKNRPAKARRLMDSWAKRFYTHFGNPPLSSVTTFQVEDFRDWLLTQETVSVNWDNQKILSPKTVKEILVWLSAVFRYLKIENPVVGVERPKSPKHKVFEDMVRFYDEEEMQKISKAAEDTVFRLPLQILLYTGCRPAELRSLSNNSEQIILEKKTLVFIDKRGRQRGIELKEEPFNRAWKSLIEWIRIHDIKKGEKVFPQGKNWFSRRWHTVLKRAGLPKTRTHQIRHQFVKMTFYDLGCDLTSISKWCGHSTDVCYKTYSNLFIQAPKGNKKAKPKISTLSPKARDTLKKKIRENPIQRDLYRAEAKMGMYDEDAGKPVAHEGETVTISKSDYEDLLHRAQRS